MERDSSRAALILSDWQAFCPGDVPSEWVLVLGAAVVVVMGLVIGWWLSPPRYQAQARLFTEAEWRFWEVLNQAVGGRYLVVGKVRIADVIMPRSTVRRQAWWRAFRQISSKHLDFVLLDPRTGAIRGALELDDASHRRTDRRTRDRFVDRALAQAGVPLMRVVAARRYAPGELARQIETAINGRG